MARAPDQLEAMLAKARWLRRTESADTETYLKKVLEQFPSAEPDVDLELGRLYRGQKKLDEAKTIMEAAIEKMGNYSPVKQAEIVLAYARVLRDRNENDVAILSYKQAASLGNLEASYWLSTMLSGGDKEQRVEAKRGCERYLAAGASLRYTEDARQVCNSLR